jgi:hypothetical protein
LLVEHAAATGGSTPWWWHRRALAREILRLITEQLAALEGRIDTVEDRIRNGTAGNDRLFSAAAQARRPVAPGGARRCVRASCSRPLAGRRWSQEKGRLDGRPSSFREAKEDGNVLAALGVTLGVSG